MYTYDVTKNNIEWFTLSQWNAYGYRVKKGSKSHKRDKDGTPLFDSWQVEKAKQDSWQSEATVQQLEEEYDPDIWGPEDELRMDYD